MWVMTIAYCDTFIMASYIRRVHLHIPQKKLQFHNETVISEKLHRFDNLLDAHYKLHSI